MFIGLEQQPCAGQLLRRGCFTDRRPHRGQPASDVGSGVGEAFQTVDIVGAGHRCEVMCAGDVPRVFVDAQEERSIPELHPRLEFQLAASESDVVHHVVPAVEQITAAD
jgi:hypothetical protein